MPITDEEAALKAIATLDTLSKDQQDARSRIDAVFVSSDPIVDIHHLFSLYNILYFRSLLLPRVEVSWSPRLTLCAGICELVRNPDDGNKFTKIRLKLSEPLLKYRPRSDVVNTLLHEAIHAYFFITTSWRHSRGDDGTGHGAGFLLLADAVNNHGNYAVSVYHTFHDEVDSYRTHIWQCDGPCRFQAPFFGLVKRSMNRAPGKSDTWWAKHQDECAGTFTKIAQPELTKAQVEKLSSLERAGRQKCKIDAWVRTKVDDFRGAEEKVVDAPSEVGAKRSRSTDGEEGAVKRVKDSVSCPVCREDVGMKEINEHLDLKHPP